MEDGETVETESVPMLRYYRVFNDDQGEAIEAPARVERGNLKTSAQKKNILQPSTMNILTPQVTIPA